MTRIERTFFVMVAAAAIGGLSACGDSGGSGTDDVTTDTPADESVDIATDTADETPVGDAPEDVAEDAPPADTVEEIAEDPAEDPAGEEPGDECLPAATPSGDEGHRAGQDCLSCHASMGGGRAWTIAGTLYSDSSGTSPVSGATIIVTDDTGAELLLVTHPNGNFYTTQSVTFPLTVAASKCPDHAAMSSTVSSGSCNSCHGSSMRIHLP